MKKIIVELCVFLIVVIVLVISAVNLVKTVKQAAEAQGHRNDDIITSLLNR